MFSIMTKYYNKGGMVHQITDFADAQKTKSAAELTKMFVDKASFILRANIGGGMGSKSKEEIKKSSSLIKAGQPLWDPKQLQVKDWFSSHTYLVVQKIEPDKITVKNQLGGIWHISKDVLESMYSADHYEKEVPMNMTSLVGILEEAGDTIMKVQFKTKIYEKRVFEKLQNVDPKSLKSGLDALAKDLIEGE